MALDNRYPTFTDETAGVRWPAAHLRKKILKTKHKSMYFRVKNGLMWRWVCSTVRNVRVAALYVAVVYQEKH